VRLQLKEGRNCVICIFRQWNTQHRLWRNSFVKHWRVWTLWAVMDFYMHSPRTPFVTKTKGRNKRKGKKERCWIKNWNKSVTCLTWTWQLDQLVRYAGVAVFMGKLYSCCVRKNAAVPDPGPGPGYVDLPCQYRVYSSYNLQE